MSNPTRPVPEILIDGVPPTSQRHATQLAGCSITYFLMATNRKSSLIKGHIVTYLDQVDDQIPLDNKAYKAIEYLEHAGKMHYGGGLLPKVQVTP